MHDVGVVQVVHPAQRLAGEKRLVWENGGLVTWFKGWSDLDLTFKTVVITVVNRYPVTF